MTSASEDLDQLCKHEITRRFCADCNGTVEKFRREHDLEVERVLGLGDWFPARYGGRCRMCGERFHSGTPIKRFPASETLYIAMCCAPGEGE